MSRDEILRRLRTWFYWVTSSRPTMSPNPIAAMMKRADGELPGSDLSIPRGMTPELESVEKAVARMRAQYPIPRRLLIDVYVNGKFLHEVAADRRWSEDKTRTELERAESICGRFMVDIDIEISKKRLAIPGREH